MHAWAVLGLGGKLAASWGVAGVLLLLVQAIYRLLPFALEPLSSGMSALEWVCYLGFIAFNAYAEGYRGFQRSFSPRVAVRAMFIARNPRPLFVLLAPAFCMGLFHARRRRLIFAWVLTAFIVVLVIFVRLLPQPWRGVVDAGVVVGLAWGVASIAWFFGRAVLSGHVPADDSLP
jgi:hypothetical protein